MSSEEGEKRAERGSRQLYFRRNRNGTVTWYCRFVDVDGVRKKRRLKAETKHGPSGLRDARAEAQLELQEILARVRQGKPGIAVVAERQLTTIRDLAEKFCGKDDEWKSGHGAASRDPEHYRRQAWSVFKSHIVETHGDLIASEVRPKDVVRLRDGLQAKKKHARTVQRALGHLSLLYSWAIENGHVDCANPARDVKKPSPKSRSSFYTPAEVARLLAVAAEGWPDLHPLIAFAFYTGCRRGELAGLRVGDCDLDDGKIVVTRSWEHNARKSGEPVTIQVHPHLDAILRPLLEGRPAEALVFPDPANDRMRDKFDIWGIDEVLTKAEITKPLRPWHSFRHSHGTALAASGAGLAEIQEALGQSSLEMARRYTRISAAMVRERVHALPTLGPIAPRKVTSITQARRPATKSDGARTTIGPKGGRRSRKSSEPGGI